MDDDALAEEALALAGNGGRGNANAEWDDDEDDEDDESWVSARAKYLIPSGVCNVLP